MRLPRSTSWMLPALAAAPLPVGAGLKEGDAGVDAAERAGRLLASPEAPPPLCAPLVRPPPPHPAATSAASAKPASARPRLVIGRIVIPPSRSHPFPLLPAAVARSDACTAPMVPEGVWTAVCRLVWFLEAFRTAPPVKHRGARCDRRRLPYQAVEPHRLHPPRADPRAVHRLRRGRARLPGRLVARAGAGVRQHHPGGVHHRHGVHGRSRLRQPGRRPLGDPQLP